MKNPTNRPGYFATAAATDSSSPGTLAISATRDTRMAIHLADPAVGQRLGRARQLPSELESHSFAPCRSGPYFSRPRASKNRVEKKWQCVSLAASYSVRRAPIRRRNRSRRAASPCRAGPCESSLKSRLTLSSSRSNTFAFMPNEPFSSLNESLAESDVRKQWLAVERVEILRREPLGVDEVPAEHVERKRQVRGHAHVGARRIRDLIRKIGRLSVSPGCRPGRSSRSIGSWRSRAARFCRKVPDQIEERLKAGRAGAEQLHFVTRRQPHVQPDRQAGRRGPRDRVSSGARSGRRVRWRCRWP